MYGKKTWSPKGWCQRFHQDCKTFCDFCLVLDLEDLWYKVSVKWMIILAGRTVTWPQWGEIMEGSYPRENILRQFLSFCLINQDLWGVCPNKETYWTRNNNETPKNSGDDLLQYKRNSLWILRLALLIYFLHGKMHNFLVDARAIWFGWRYSRFKTSRHSLWIEEERVVQQWKQYWVCRTDIFINLKTS